MLINYDDSYDFKEFVVKTGLINLYVAYRHYDYYFEKWLNDMQKDKFEIIPLSYFPYADFSYFMNTYPYLWKICENMYLARLQKARRIKNRLFFMNKFYSDKTFYFLTMTWTNDNLDNTSSKTRREYVTSYLRSISYSYVSNIDFGEKFDREHYHAVVVADYIYASDWNRRFGNLNFEVIPSLDKDNVKIARYIDKLSSHAVKGSTGFAIYSRDLSFLEDLDFIQSQEDFPYFPYMI